MTIQEKVEAEWKAAMKARSPTKDALNLIKTELKNRAITDRKAGDSTTLVSDDVALSVLSKMAKQRQDSIADYQKGGRQDLVDAETAELNVVQSFLPEQMSEEELREVIRVTIAEVSYSGQKDTGKLMKALMPKVKGRVDGKRIQEVVKEVTA